MACQGPFMNQEEEGPTEGNHGDHDKSQPRGEPIKSVVEAEKECNREQRVDEATHKETQ
jgi:hypothetical protein